MMTRSPLFVMRRGLVAVTVVALVGILAPVMSAQLALAQPAVQSPAQSPTKPGPVLPLSMAQAEAMALESNLGLKADRIAPEIASENLAAARAAFIPAISSALSRSSTERATEASDKCDTSIMMPSLFISAITVSPKGLTPFHFFVAAFVPHRPTQRVGLAGGESGARDRNLHALFLK